MPQCATEPSLTKLLQSSLLGVQALSFVAVAQTLQGYLFD